MKLTKRQLKRIIREEYSRLKRRGLIKESFGPNGAILDHVRMAGVNGIHIEDLASKLGVAIGDIFDSIDRLEESGEIYFDVETEHVIAT